MDHLFIHHELQQGEYGFTHFVMDYLKTIVWISTTLWDVWDMDKEESIKFKIQYIIYSFIYSSSATYPTRVTGAGVYPRQEAGYNQDKSPVHCRAVYFLILPNPNLVTWWGILIHFLGNKEWILGKKKKIQTSGFKCGSKFKHNPRNLQLPPMCI